MEEESEQSWIEPKDPDYYKKCLQGHMMELTDKVPLHYLDEDGERTSIYCNGECRKPIPAVDGFWRCNEFCDFDLCRKCLISK